MYLNCSVTEYLGLGLNMFPYHFYKSVLDHPINNAILEYNLLRKDNFTLSFIVFGLSD